jgi:hypothetical protein
VIKKDVERKYKKEKKRNNDKIEEDEGGYAKDNIKSGKVGKCLQLNTICKSACTSFRII